MEIKLYIQFYFALTKTFPKRFTVLYFYSL